MKSQKCCDQRWNSSLCWIGQLRCLNWVNLARDDYDEPHFDLKEKCNDNLSHQLPIILVAAKKSYQLLYLYLDEIQSIFFCIVSKSLRIYMVFDKSLPGGKSKPLYLCTVFENHPQCRILIFQFWQFPPIVDLLKLTCLVTLFDRKL